MHRTTTGPWRLLTSLLSLALLASACGIKPATPSPAGTAASPVGTATPAPAPASAVAYKSPVIGASGAPVTIIEYFDYQ